MKIKSDMLTEQMAPVSGARCRDCGARPWRKPGEWVVTLGCAYCPSCSLPAEAREIIGLDSIRVDLMLKGGE